ncbi:MAG: polysaccharide deacetylase family protein [Bacteroidia bacterium]|nr:polysaccharide deacetylase family protein [Bacteroidia bacterium]
MGFISSFARKVVFPLVTATGAERLFWNSSDNKRIILCYHGATQHPNFFINGRHISTSQLEQHFIYFKKHFDVVPVSDFDKTKKYSGIRPQLALTFDDGFTNNMHEVLPLMKKYEIPVSFYITTSCLIDSDFLTWADIIELVVYVHKLKEIEFGNKKFKLTDSWKDADSLNLFDYIKSMGEERDGFITLFKEQYDFAYVRQKVPADYYKMLNTDELKYFASSHLVEIGSHTHRHYNLANISSSLVASELLKSRLQLEGILDRPITTIAFPDGSYNDTVKVLAKEAGYKQLLAVDYRCQSDVSDTAIFPRFTISNTTTFSSNMIRMARFASSRGF